MVEDFSLELSVVALALTLMGSLLTTVLLKEPAVEEEGASELTVVVDCFSVVVVSSNGFGATVDTTRITALLNSTSSWLLSDGN